MFVWKQDGSPETPDLLDHVTDFRLNLAAAQDPSHVDEIWWSALILLVDTSIDTFVRSARHFADDLLVPVAYDAGDRKRKLPLQPVAIYAREVFLRALNRNSNGFGVSDVHLGAKASVETLNFNASPPNLSEIPVSDDTVVTAVVDDGIAVAHDLFRQTRVSTRIAHASILGAATVADGDCSVGRTLDRKQIDSLMAIETYNDLLDESAFYQRTGVIDWRSDDISPVAMRVSHGTHVMGLAAGHPLDGDTPVNRPILCVSLPSQLVADTTGLDALPTLYLSLHILRRQARRFRTRTRGLAPLVVNFSFGNSGGPHDGTSLFNRLFDYYFGPDADCADEPQPAWLTLPAGNLNLARMHGVVGPETSSSLDLTVLPDDGTPSLVQMWMPMGDEVSTDPFDIRVTTPTRQSAAITSIPGQHAILVDDEGAEVARLACQREAGETQRTLVTLLINPTVQRSGQGPVAPQGNWRIEITRPDELSDKRVELWIRRDETLPGKRQGGRQAWFSNHDYKRFGRFGRPLAVDPHGSDCPVRRSTTLSGFACGAAPVVVAAYSAKEARVSEYSAAGPLVGRDRPPLPDRQGPDVAAKGDDSYLLRGVISAGSNSGSWVRLSGTSVAAPRVARAAIDREHGWDEGARHWISTATAETPFELSGRDLPTRAGDGGIKIAFRRNSIGRS